MGQNPAVKAHGLLKGPITINTANVLLQLLPHLPPLESQQVRERIFSMCTRPPPPPRGGSHSNARNRDCCTPRAGSPTPAACEQQPRKIWPPTPRRTSTSQCEHAGSPDGSQRHCTPGAPPCSAFVSGLRYSVARASVILKAQMARPLLQLHSYAHLYLPTLSLHGQLFEVHTRQVRTIGGATLHHVAMAHQKYSN